jgi:hypothetical protein
VSSYIVLLSFQTQISSIVYFLSCITSSAYLSSFVIPSQPNFLPSVLFGALFLHPTCIQMKHLESLSFLFITLQNLRKGAANCCLFQQRTLDSQFPTIVFLFGAWFGPSLVSQMPPSTGGMLSHESTTHTQLQGKKSITTSLSSSSPLFAATPSTRTRFGGRNKKYFPPLYYCYLDNSSGSLSFAAYNAFNIYVKIDFRLVTYLQGLN